MYIKILMDYFVICLIRPQLFHLLFTDLPTQFFRVFSPVSFIILKNLCLIMRVLAFIINLGQNMY